MSSCLWGLSPLVSQSTWENQLFELVLLIITVAEACALIITTDALQVEVNRVAITASVAAVVAKWQGCQLLHSLTTCSPPNLTLVVRHHCSITIQTTCSFQFLSRCEDQGCRQRQLHHIAVPTQRCIGVGDVHFS